MSKIESLEPEFRTKVEQLIAAIENVTGRKWIITAGRRTMAEQEALYNQGRSTPGNIVTKAPAGSSAHNFGLAVDLVSIKENGDADWSDNYEGWKQLADLAVEMGLTAGMYFKSLTDRPHVEDKSWKIAQGEWKAGRVHIA